MKKRLLRIVPIFAGVAVATLLLVIVAQANINDARIKVGHLLPVSDPFVLAGALYKLDENGHLETGPPICRVGLSLRDKYFNQYKAKLKISNVLGQSLPIISRVSTFIVAPIDPTLIADELVLTIDGHTLEIGELNHVQLTDYAVLAEYIAEVYKASPACEREVITRYQDGECIVLVHQTASTADGTILGYGYNNHCMKADLGDDPADYAKLPEEAPRPFRRIAERLSDFKDYVGLISVAL